MSKHTPGPWHLADITPDKINIRGPISPGFNGDKLASVQRLRDGDALLIASAPELLEALELTINALANVTNEDFKFTARKYAEKILAKARGES